MCRVLSVMLAASAAGCVEGERIAPTANEIAVHAVLDASAGDQYVVVQAAFGSGAYQRPITDATVTLTLPDGSAVTAIATADTSVAKARYGDPPITTVYRVPLGSLGIALVPGGTYQLHVSVPDGRVVTGTTMVPNAVMDTVSGGPDTLNAATETLHLSWARAASARSYAVMVKSPNIITYSAFADTVISIRGSAGNPSAGPSAFYKGTTYRVMVLAVDVNYYDYYRRSSDFLSGSGLITHLTGGIGVFGAVVPVLSRVVSVK